MNHVALRKIQKFRQFEEGWHFGEGIPFAESTLHMAAGLIEEAVRLSLFEIDAFPGTAGDIMVTMCYHDDYLEYTIEPDGSISFYAERKSAEIDQIEGLTLEEAQIKLREYRNREFQHM